MNSIEINGARVECSKELIDALNKAIQGVPAVKREWDSKTEQYKEESAEYYIQLTPETFYHNKRITMPLV